MLTNNLMCIACKSYQCHSKKIDSVAKMIIRELQYKKSSVERKLEYIYELKNKVTVTRNLKFYMIFLISAKHGNSSLPYYPHCERRKFPPNYIVIMRNEMTLGTDAIREVICSYGMLPNYCIAIVGNFLKHHVRI